MINQTATGFKKRISLLQRDAKELVRDSITGFGLNPVHLRIRKAMGENVDHLFRSTLAERFTAIYRNRVWLNGRPSGSLSGLGSELRNTDAIQRGLPKLLEELGTQTLLDVGCGDFLWMKEIPLVCRYIGIDIVEHLVVLNERLYGSAARIFQNLDATSEPLPPADTALCREVLFHLSFADIWKVLARVQRSGAAFLIATTDLAVNYNADIKSGDFRLLNFRQGPFCLPAPMAFIPDNQLSPGRTLSVWKTSGIRIP